MADNERNYEEEARKDGWVPKEEWKGDKPWRDAKDFVERGEKIIPILKNKVDRLTQDLAMTIKLNTDEVNRSRKEGYDRAKAEYDKALEELEEQEFTAVQEGKSEEYVKIKDKKKNLKEPKKPEEVKPDKQAPPEFLVWNEKNTWYNKDPEMTDYADFVGNKIRTDNPGLTAEDFYAKVEKRVRLTFPQKFTNSNRDAGNNVDSSGNQVLHKKGKKTWSDLPPEAKSAYKRLEINFKAQKREIKKEDFVKNYFEQEED